MRKLDSLRRFVALAAVTASVVVGCATATVPDGNDDGECSIGAEGCECTLGGGCDVGLVCLSKFCVDPNGSVTSGGGGAPSTGSSTGAAGTTNSTSGPSTTTTTSTTAATTSATTAAATTSAATTSSTGSGACSVPNPTTVMGCTTCGVCETWTASWLPVAGATHYRVKFLCSGVAHESPDIFDTNAELCLEVGMCSYCSNGLAGMWIEACDGTCCSSGTPIPENEAPLGCQVDCCL